LLVAVGKSRSTVVDTIEMKDKWSGGEPLLLGAVKWLIPTTDDFNSQLRSSRNAGDGRLVCRLSHPTSNDTNESFCQRESIVVYQYQSCCCPAAVDPQM